MELKGKVALVTGASRGIGAQIAEELARRGANVRRTLSSLLTKILTTPAALHHLDAIGPQQGERGGSVGQACTG